MWHWWHVRECYHTDSCLKSTISDLTHMRRVQRGRVESLPCLCWEPGLAAGLPCSASDLGLAKPECAAQWFGKARKAGMASSGGGVLLASRSPPSPHAAVCPNARQGRDTWVVPMLTAEAYPQLVLLSVRAEKQSSRLIVLVLKVLYYLKQTPQNSNHQMLCWCRSLAMGSVHWG